MKEKTELFLCIFVRFTSSISFILLKNSEGKNRLKIYLLNIRYMVRLAQVLIIDHFGIFRWIT